jgi:prepilin-type processing-associated H-X9-DG protein
MGFKYLLNTPDNAGSSINANSNSVLRPFMCPSEWGSFSDVHPATTDNPGGTYYISAWNEYVAYSQGALGNYDFPSSYIYNEAVLGIGFSDNYGRLRGHASAVHQAASTLFAADGTHSGYANGVAGTAVRTFPFPYGYMTVYNKTNMTCTLSDALAGNTLAGDPANFDSKRHKGLINVAFCDGHVETRHISASDLQNIYLLAP